MEEFKRQLKTLTVKHKEAEARAEFAEKTVKKLQKEVDRLEGEIPNPGIPTLILCGLRNQGFQYPHRVACGTRDSNNHFAWLTEPQGFQHPYRGTSVAYAVGVLRSLY